MTSEAFLNYINHPELLSKSSLEETRKLAELFPFSQNIQLLYLFNLSKSNDIRFGDQLRRTASHIPNRKLLKKHLDHLESASDLRVDQKEAVEQKVVAAEVIPELKEEKQELLANPESPIIVEQEQVLEKKAKSPIPQKETASHDDILEKRNAIRSKAELLQLVKNRLAEIEKEKTEKAIKQVEKAKPIQNKIDLIDKFISLEPSISRPEKTAFFDPDVAAQESLFEDGAFVTETLARIYADQGNIKKAIEIYRILSLNNPEKSSYFAALIQELENKLN